MRKPNDNTRRNGCRLERLVRHWKAKADECDRTLMRNAGYDPVTSAQAATAGEVYRTCIRELQHVLPQPGGKK